MSAAFNPQEKVLLDIIGPDLFFEVSERLGGGQLYVQRAHWTEIRNEHIRQQYDSIVETAPSVRYCDVIRKLGREYGLSIRHIRNILSEKKVQFYK